MKSACDGIAGLGVLDPEEFGEWFLFGEVDLELAKELGSPRLCLHHIGETPP